MYCNVLSFVHLWSNAFAVITVLLVHCPVYVTVSVIVTLHVSPITAHLIPYQTPRLKDPTS